ncbi:NAD(P)H-quinone oxidoreductase chain [Dorcoceras hygrometricum]|uniref:NAD(P)H-quinone oxidoreductase chain n=1 Tax=Dorcoceras hygrometricum TaxID=472368 RepID=A0A2Z7BG48_9LAMI|nr:NAD(P)H-quinone oxidoreductase chain [Dorcoceras hygrometricum]
MERSNLGTHFPFVPADSTTYAHFSPFGSKGKSWNPEGVNAHQRCSSESFLEEQPSWLDDLLNDSEIFIHKGHRRSASDSYAYIGDAAEKCSIRGKPIYESPFIGNPAPQKDVDNTSIGNKINSLDEKSDRAEGSEVSAELRFLEQQNAILVMENRALRQRLESISQEQIIKHWEQEMLEREIGRLQTLYHYRSSSNRCRLNNNNSNNIIPNNAETTSTNRTFPSEERMQGRLSSDQ